MKKPLFRCALLATLPVMAAYLVLGMGFGVLMASKGYSPWWALLMSVTVYAGSMQYVGVELLAGGAALLPAALMTLMVNARHLFYGFSMLETYRDLGWRKWYAVYALSDETYSLVCGAGELPEGVDRRDYFFLVSLLDQLYWFTGSVLGAALGRALPFDTAGVDFAMTALFVSIFVDQWEKTKEHRPAVLGLLLSLACLLIFGPDRFLIPAMALISFALLLCRGKIEGGEAA